MPPAAYRRGMRIAVLGPLEVRTDDGAPVAVPGAKERLLLAVLAAGRRASSAPTASSRTLWNGDRPATARKSLQVHLVHLRSALEPDRPRGSTGRYVVRRGTGYALAATERRRRPADRRPRRARPRPAGRRGSRGGRAAAVRRPRPLARRALRRLAGRLVRRRRAAAAGRGPDRRRDRAARGPARPGRARRRGRGGRAAAGRGPAAGGVVAAARAGAVPRRPAGRRARGGRRGPAPVLVEELGAEPGPRLRAVEAAVLAQDPALDLPASPSPVSRPSSGRRGLPVQGAGHLPGGRRRAVPRPEPGGHPAGGAGWSTRRCSWCPGRAAPASPPLVRAGLVPALAGGALPGSAAWQAVVVTPGPRPVDALAALTGDRPARRAGPAGLRPVRGALGARGGPGRSGPPSSTPSSACSTTAIVVRCVAVVRGDHVGRLAEHAAFTERLGAALVLVPAADRGRAARGRPRAGGRGRPDRGRPSSSTPSWPTSAGRPACPAAAVDGAGRHVGAPPRRPAHPGRLPRGRRRRRRADPVRRGRLRGSRRARAESSPAACSCGWPTPTTAGRSSGVPLPLAELDLDGDGGAVRRAVVDAFVDRRLLVVDGDRLDVAHEALLTAWPRLARWLEDDAAGRAVRRHLDPGRAGVAAPGRAGRRAVPRRPPRRRPGLGRRRADDELDRRGAAVPRRLEGAGRRRADRGARAGPTARPAARRRTRRLAVGLAAVLVVALVAAGLAVRASGRPSRPRRGRADVAGRRREPAGRPVDDGRLAGPVVPAGRPGIPARRHPGDAGRAARRARRAPARGPRGALPRGAAWAPTSATADGPSSSPGVRGTPRLGRRLGRAAPRPGSVGRRLVEGGRPPPPRPPTRWRPGGFDVVGVDERPWVRDGRRGRARPARAERRALGGEPLDVSFTADGRLVDVLVAAPSDADGGRPGAWSRSTPPTAPRTRGRRVAERLPTGDLEADISDGPVDGRGLVSGRQFRGPSLDLAPERQARPYRTGTASCR